MEFLFPFPHIIMLILALLFSSFVVCVEYSKKKIVRYITSLQDCLLVHSRSMIELATRTQVTKNPLAYRQKLALKVPHDSAIVLWQLVIQSLLLSRVALLLTGTS